MGSLNLFTLRRILLIKQMFLQASLLRTDGSDISSMMACHHLDMCMELSLKTILMFLNPISKIKGVGFSQLWEKTEEIYLEKYTKNLPYRTEIHKLRNLRNNVQHEGMKMNYLKESLIYFLGTLDFHTDDLFRLSIESSNRIAYMYVYNTTWTEYLLPIGKWILRRQGMTQTNYFGIWRELMDYSNEKYVELFRIFCPIIRNAFVHGEYYQQEDHSFIFYSKEYPEFSPQHIAPAAINLFQLKSFFDHHLHPNTFLGFEKFGLAKYWIEIVEKEEETAEVWQHQINEIEMLDHNILGVMMRVRLISEKIPSESLNFIKKDIEVLVKDKLVAINDQNTLVLVITSLFLNNKEHKCLYLLIEQITQIADEFFLLNPKIRLLLLEMQLYLAKRRKAWREAKRLQKKIKPLKRSRK